ncbi:CBS domain-containing protein [Actinophytocola algeriensis]|uniref:CBS domain-containing protein n=1 Tax=Actinophytocola algeriensis TaxID=1768010 RepID=A0A7W7VFV3_9PSEU|nr:CBS domain-containing protein [Actinophytocola algeriensis]MBB4908772.1 CBS domain-containing protein [Actinophytocola algeriensis]MBE1474841.1 CBS domain-containing protein [Actinophytocola algeriensis]
MRASDVVQTLPVARLGDAVLPAMRTVTRRDLPGLVVVDEQDQVVACVSLTDLIGLVLPRYLRDSGPCLARTFDEAHADRIAESLLGAAVRDVVGEAAERIPVVRADATLVELAETMSRQRCALVMVEQRETGMLGVVTARRLLEVLVDAAVDETPR